MKKKATPSKLVHAKSGAPIGVLDIIVDIGNSLVKGMVQGRPNSAVVLPHAVRLEIPETFATTLARSSNSLRGGESTDISMFEYRGNAVTVGENAEAIGAMPSKVGGEKYTRDYYGALFMALMLRLRPAGHENIRVMSLFPPGDINYMDEMMNSLGGKHTVKLVNGTIVTYVVKEVLSCDEPVGGLRNFLLAGDGVHYRIPSISSGLALCVDIGGKISSLVPFRSDGWVDYSSAKSIDSGIQDVMNRVGVGLVKQYKNNLPGIRGTGLPHDSSMRECLVTGVYQGAGYDLDATAIVSDAAAGVLNSIRNLYINDLGGPRPYRYIIVTGGGGGLLFEQLKEHVLSFNTERIFLSHDNPEAMHLSNLFGANKTVAALMASGKI